MFVYFTLEFVSYKKTSSNFSEGRGHYGKHAPRELVTTIMEH